MPARHGRSCPSDTALWGRGWYFEHIAVDPKNADIVYVPNVAVSRSKDGGKTWVALRGSPGGDDYHQAWVSPDDSNTMIVASDQGTIITRNAQDRRSARRHVELVAQPADGADLSRVGRLSLSVLGDRRAAGQRRGGGALARQVRRDLDARLGADRRRRRERHTPRAIRCIPGIIFGGTGQRFDLETEHAGARHDGAARRPDRARTDWTQPLVFSQADPHALYYANQFLFKTTDGAQTWTQISRDLTRPIPGVPANLDAAAAAQTRIATASAA